MLDKLNHLTDDERQELFDAVPIITILIAGADGHIDPKELEWSEKLTKIRGYTGSQSLQEFYDKVGENYSDRLLRWQEVLPNETEERNADISARLTNLNPILAKLETELGAEFYKSFTSFAEHVAKASGGFLGFGSISSEEAALINLPMLTPIENDEDGDTDGDEENE